MSSREAVRVELCTVSSGVRAAGRIERAMGEGKMTPAILPPPCADLLRQTSYRVASEVTTTRALSLSHHR